MNNNITQNNNNFYKNTNYNNDINNNIDPNENILLTIANQVDSPEDNVDLIKKLLGQYYSSEEHETSVKKDGVSICSLPNEVFEMLENEKERKKFDILTNNTKDLSTIIIKAFALPLINAKLYYEKKKEKTPSEEFYYGNTLRQMGRFKKAKSVFEDCLKDTCKLSNNQTLYSETLGAYADTLYRLNLYKQAMEANKKAYELSPDNEFLNALAKQREKELIETTPLEDDGVSICPIPNNVLQMLETEKNNQINKSQKNPFLQIHSNNSNHLIQTANKQNEDPSELSLLFAELDFSPIGQKSNKNHHIQEKKETFNTPPKQSYPQIINRSNHSNHFTQITNKKLDQNNPISIQKTEEIDIMENFQNSLPIYSSSDNSFHKLEEKQSNYEKIDLKTFADITNYSCLLRQLGKFEKAKIYLEQKCLTNKTVLSKNPILHSRILRIYADILYRYAHTLPWSLETVKYKVQAAELEKQANNLHFEDPLNKILIEKRIKDNIITTLDKFDDLLL